jgi:hypothetical protein
MASLQKNVAGQNFTFALINASTGAALTGATVTVYVTKDGGAQATGAGTVTGQGNGQYNYAPTQSETNAADVGFLCTASGAIPCNLDFHTDQVDGSGLVKVDLEDVGGTALATHASGLVPADLRDIAGSAVSTTAAQLGVNVVEYNGQTAATDGNNLPKVDVEDINGNALAAQALNNSTNSICWGTASGGSTTTVTVASLNNPSSLTDSGQLIGRTIIFLGSTTTADMQAQASNVTASTTGATPTITFTAMTHAPASGDKFVIL